MQSSLDALAAQLERFVAHVREQTEVPGIAVAISNLEHRIYIIVVVLSDLHAEITHTMLNNTKIF